MQNPARATIALALALASGPALAALSGSFTDGSLRIVSNADDDIRIGCAVDTDARVSVNFGDPNVPTPRCSEVRRIEIVGGPGSNETNLDDVTAALFTALLSTHQRGNAGDDVLGGSFAPDLMEGGSGIDSMTGRGGDDELRWSPGDENDVFVGGDGQDRAQIAGLAAAVDRFRLGPLTDGVRIEHGSPVSETLVVFDTETVRLDAGDAIDRVETRALPEVVQELHGGDPDAFPGDVLQIDGTSGDISNSPVILAGGGPIHHAGFEFGPPPAPAATLSKSAAVLSIDADGNGVVSRGDTLRYAVTLLNTGNVALTAVTIADPQLVPASVACASVAAQATCTLSGDHLVTAADADARRVVNVARANATPLAQELVSNTVVTPVVVAAPTPLSVPVRAPGALLALVLAVLAIGTRLIHRA